MEAEDTRSFLGESSNVRVESPVLEVLDQDCDNGSRSCTTCIGIMKDVRCLTVSVFLKRHFEKK